MSAEEIAKLLNTGNTEESTLITLLGEYFYSPTQSQVYSDCEGSDGLSLTITEQLHFTSQQKLSQHLEKQKEEYDDEEPLITSATSKTIVVKPEDLELDERAMNSREGGN
uniref:Uncharacterized protein n=1 Tax=Amphimedon queenslandica TaxID=400682 RepID=A0A1X7U5T9_AMPQE